MNEKDKQTVIFLMSVIPPQEIDCPAIQCLSRQIKRGDADMSSAFAYFDGPGKTYLKAYESAKHN